MTTLIAAAFFAAQCVLKEEQEYGIHYCCRCCRGRHCLLLSLLQEGPADPGIVVTGFGLSRPKVVCGRGVFVLPIVQRADRLNMRLLKIDVKNAGNGR